MSNELLQFNEQFPNSNYREIHQQYVGDDYKMYQNSKAPISKDIKTFEQIKDTQNRIGWIVPKDYIVIDIDNKKNAKVVFDILQAMKIRFSFMTGRKGGHFIFKNHRKIKSISAGQYCGLGFTVDVRTGDKGYIILPENDTDRSWGNITNQIDDVPYFLIPLKGFKAQDELLDLGEGDGRNDALLRHILGLIDYASQLTLDEKCECVRLINNFMFKVPLTDDELSKTVLRQDILDKQESEPEEHGCYEEKLAARIIRDKQIITCNDICYLYTGKYYKPVPDTTEIERIIHLEYNPNLKDNKRKEIVKFIKLKSYVPVTELNKNWNEIVFKNGILNLTTMQMKEHTPSLYNTIYVDCNYIPDAPYSPAIDAFFNQISSEEDDKKDLLYEIVGYCLIRKNVFEKFFICYGEGQTGKSTYLKMILHLVGEPNAAFLSLNDLEEPFMPVSLFGKLVNIGDDIPYKGLKESAILKKVVTGETFAAQQKFKDPLNFSNFAKLIFTTNKLPEVYDRTSGFYRRVMIIDINRKITNPDHFFLERLTDADYEYLLSKAISKVVKAMSVGKLTECMSSSLKLMEYKTEQSSILSFASDNSYDTVSIDHIPCMVLYNEYVKYCQDTGFKALKKINFDKEICGEFKMNKRNTTNASTHDTNQCWRFVKC